MGFLKFAQCPRCFISYFEKTQRRSQSVGSWCVECQCTLLLSQEDAARARLEERGLLDTRRAAEQIHRLAQEASGDAQLNAGFERPRPSQEMEIIPFD